MRGRLYICFLFSMAAGILAGRIVPLAVALPVTSLAALAFAALSIRRFEPLRFARLPLLFFGLGVLLITLAGATTSGGLLPLLARSHANVEVEGVVSTTPSYEQGRTSFYFEVGFLRQGRRSWRTSETSLVSLPGAGKGNELFAGRKLAIKGVVSAPLSGTIFARGCASVIQAASAKGEGALPVYSLVNVARNAMTSSFKASFDRETAPFIGGVTMSRLEDLNENVLSDLRACGLSHLVAVAGLHVGAAAVLALALLSVLGAGRRTRYLTASLVALSVMSLACFRVSSVRAAIMACLAFAAAMIGRRGDPLVGLSLAGIFILARSPAALFDRSFQFSFAAALAIVTAVSMAKRVGWLRSFLCVSAAAQLGIAPLLLLQGEGVPVSALAANVICVPLVGPLLLMSWLVALLTPISHALGRVAAFLPGKVALFVMWVASVFAKVPSARPAGAAGTVALIVYCTALVFVIRACRSGRPLFAPLAAVSLAAVIVLVGFFPVPSFGSRESVTALDVGEGDAILIRDSTGATVLVDGGPDENKLERKLQERGVPRIDLIVSSHPHADHSTGLLAAMSDLPCGRLIHDSLPSQDAELERMTRLAAARNIPATVAREGDVLRVSERMSLEVLYPPVEGLPTSTSVNDSSMVVMATVGGADVLLMGDLEAGGQKILLARHPDLSCDVLKVPHQGASNAATDELLAAARPGLAIICVEKGNKYGHPSARCMDLLAGRGVRVMRTDRDGDVEVAISGGRIGIAARRGGQLGEEEGGQPGGARTPVFPVRGGRAAGGALARQAEGAVLEGGGPGLQHDCDDRAGVLGGGHHRGCPDRSAAVEPASGDRPGRGPPEPQGAGEARCLRGDGGPRDHHRPRRQVPGQV